MSSDVQKLIRKTGSEPIGGEVAYSTTGLIGLDWALGGGIARGRLIEFHGLESSGKSTIGLQAAIAEVHRTGVAALWLDYEYAWNPEYVIGLGATPDESKESGTVEFELAQPVSVEKGFELAKGAMEGGHVSSVWFDSTGVMESETSGIGTRARAMASGIPHVLRAVAKADVVCGFISQTREVLQTGFGGFQQGPKRMATGGAAIKFAFSQRVEFTHKAKLKGRAADVTGAQIEGVIGRRVIAKVMKNKVGVPWRQMEFDLIDGIGFDRLRHLIEVGVECGVITKKGAYFDVPGIPKSIQGLQTLAAVLRDPRAEPVVGELEVAIKSALSEKGESVDMGETVLGDQEEGEDGSATVDEG